MPRSFLEQVTIGCSAFFSHLALPCKLRWRNTRVRLALRSRSFIYPQKATRSRTLQLKLVYWHEGMLSGGEDNSGHACAHGHACTLGVFCIALIANILLSLGTIFSPVFAEQEAKSRHQLSAGEVVVEIEDDAFRFDISGPNGAVFPRDDDFGLSFLGSSTKSTQLLSQTDSALSFRVTNAAGNTAIVSVGTRNGWIEFDVEIENGESGDIRLRVESPGPAFGLGDSGSYGNSANLSISQKSYSLTHNGGGRRWLSSFVVFPKARGAGVMFDRGGGSVDIGPDYYEMANNNCQQQSFYYFTGSMREIYAAYRDVRVANGYPDVSPKAACFELGWESWDALRWNTNAKSVQRSVGRFLDAGYPIRWAVTGSGFWCKNGSTVHFGQFDNKKYPDEDSDGVVDLKAWLHSRDIKWIIGQRVNFVPPDGPHYSKPGESGTTVFSTSPDSEAAIARGFVLASDDDQPVAMKSRVFPTVPCYLLDGNKPGAAAWFESLYRKWGVDGVKEDTMMATPDHTIFNPTMRQLAERGSFVMARCGAYSAPGTLMRINDTHGPSSMSARAPINYLQYAACAAPNVYSDTVGFGHINDVDATVRHAWLTSLTAGMSVSRGPWGWSVKNRELFKNAIDFHCALTPYLLSAAIESHRTGFPHTLTPLPIAFPDDENTYDLASRSRQQFEWMVGPSLLATPLLHDDYRVTDKMNIYLPSGQWVDYSTGEKFSGPTTLTDYSMPLSKPPCFVGGKGILVVRELPGESLIAKVFPVAPSGTVYNFYGSKSAMPSRIEAKFDLWNAGEMTVWDVTTDKQVDGETNEIHGAIEFEFIPGHSYRVSDAKLDRR